MNVLVTGGAGFIASHLSEALLREGHKVVVLDNLSNGNREFVPESAKFIKKDLVKDDFQADLKQIECVFHFAADPDVKQSLDAQSSFDNNLIATFNLLEACRKSNVSHFVFASTSAVYGEAKKIPTPESYPAMPISNYGASKLGCEAYVASYTQCYGIKATVLRFANIFGERSLHGVMYDFYHKLKKNPKQLEILGNGKQEKSYLYISDTIAATLLTWQKQKSQFNIFNIGSEQKIPVNTIAKTMCNQLNLNPKFTYTGGDRGWVGDVSLMLLDTKKLRNLGWKESVSFENGLQNYLKWLKT